MTAKILSFRRGDCPICHEASGEVVLGHAEVGYCETHRICWIAGLRETPEPPQDGRFAGYTWRRA